MHLGKPSQSQSTKVLSRSAHCFRFNLKASTFEFGLWEHQCRCDTLIACDFKSNAIDIADLLDLTLLPLKLFQHTRPDMIGNGNHADGLR
jgi:hypothetical protein